MVEHERQDTPSGGRRRKLSVHGRMWLIWETVGTSNQPEEQIKGRDGQAGRGRVRRGAEEEAGKDQESRQSGE